MTGDRDLERLLQQLSPQLHAGTFVYCTLPDFRIPEGLRPICTFQESEGLTAIVERAQAVEANVPFVFEARLITLTVFSSLDAIGLLAIVTGHLAKAGIPCNAVAAYHHDHLFVPVELAARAMTVLESLAGGRPSTSA